MDELAAPRSSIHALFGALYPVYVRGEAYLATHQGAEAIHLEKNGSSEGWITTTKGIVGLNADQFVPGHGDLQTKAAIQKRLADAEAKRAKIKDLVARGKSLDEIKTAVGDPPAPGRGSVGRGGPGFATFTEVVYRELTKKSS